MNTIRKSLIGIALAAAFAAPTVAVTTFCGTGCAVWEPGGWTSGSGRSGLGAGDSFFENSSGGGWNPSATLPPVTVTGSNKWNFDQVILWQTSSTLSPPIQTISFDSRDRGVVFVDEKKQAPPDNKNRQKCLDDCKNTSDLESAECDQKAAVVEGLTVVGSVAMLGRAKWAKRGISTAIDAAEYMTAKDFGLTGTTVAGGYFLICKGWASTRYLDCVNGTCKP